MPVKAGPHVVGVDVRAGRPARSSKACASRSSRRTPKAAPRSQPAVGERHDHRPVRRRRGVSDTPSRQRIFACRPGQPAAEAGVRAADPLDARAPRLPPAGRPTPSSTCCSTFYDEGRATADFESGIELALRRAARQPGVPVPRRSRPGRMSAPDPPYRVSDLELASRLSFFLWSSIPDDDAARRRGEGHAAQDRACSSSRCGGCSPIRASEALATNFAGQWLQLRTHRGLARRTSTSSRTSTRTCAATSGARPSSSSTASCARTAACSTC